MVHANIIGKFEDIFLQARMNDTVSLICENDKANSFQAPSIELSIIKANAYFELGQVEKSRETLKNILELTDSSTDTYLYACARLCYLNGELEQAEEIFNELLEYTDKQDYQFKCLLGIANILYTKYLHAQITLEVYQTKVEAIFFDLENCKPANDNKIAISYEFFKGNYARSIAIEPIETVLKHYKNVIKSASQNGWLYYQIKGLYGQATVYEAYGQLEKMKWTLDILATFIDENEMVSFTNVVNNKFKLYYEKTALPVKFDTKNQRINFGNDWMPLHDRPLIYRFLETVHGNESFVPKSEVAKYLWPEQDYKPRIHDPRIFDVAKRVKNILNDQSNSLKLLSGRVGYKLVNS